MLKIHSFFLIIFINNTLIMKDWIWKREYRSETLRSSTATGRISNRIRTNPRKLQPGVKTTFGSGRKTWHSEPTVPKKEKRIGRTAQKALQGLGRAIEAEPDSEGDPGPQRADGFRDCGDQDGNAARRGERGQFGETEEETGPAHRLHQRGNQEETGAENHFDGPAAESEGGEAAGYSDTQRGRKWNVWGFENRANIIASKKNLLEKWQKALFNIQRRDNAL